MPGHKVGDTKTLANGAVGAWKMNDAGKLVFRIIKGAHPHGSDEAKAYMATLRALKVAKRAAPLSPEDAQARFDRYYGLGRFARGKGRGHMKGKTRRGRRSAATYDKNTPARVVETGAYHPRSHDYPGVDLGARARRVASPKQRAALARGRAALARRRAGDNPVGPAARGDMLQDQQGGMQHQEGGMQHQEGGMQHQEGGMEQQGGFWW